jgi:septin family protein
MADSISVKKSRPFTVFVEGNIGSGKTTFLNHFASADVQILSEPVEMWRNVEGHNLLVSRFMPLNYILTFYKHIYFHHSLNTCLFEEFCHIGYNTLSVS